MQCILTGFDPYVKAEINPSQQAVELVADSLAIGGQPVPVRRVILPTCCNDAWQHVERAVEQTGNDKFILLMSGFASMREKITVERFALNVRHYRYADNQGHDWAEQPILDNAPDALRTSVPIGQLQETLEQTQLLADISYHAGTFVCNETYFRALNKWGKDARCGGILFVHIPSIAEYMKAQKKADGDEQAVAGVPTPEEEAEVIRQYALALTVTAKFMVSQAAPELLSATEARIEK